MLTRHMHTTLAAALIAVGSSAALADPAVIAATPGSTAYRLKVDTAAEIDSQMYKLTEKSATQRAKDAARAGKAKRPSAMLVPNSSLPDQDITKFTDQNKLADLPFAREIGLAATAAALDPALVHGIKDPSRSAQINLKAGTLYLRDLLRMFDNRTDLALAAYNAGEGAVLRHSGRIPPYRETQMYVRAVLAKYREWSDTRASGHKLRSDAVTADADFVPAQPHVEYLAGTRLDLSQAGLATKY